MGSIIRLFYNGVFGLAICNIASALTWESVDQKIAPKPGTREITVVFRYKNAEDKDVRFKQVKPDCGCTQVGDYPSLCRKGESGELAFRYDFGDRVGKVERFITVATDDGKTTTLSFRGEISDWISIAPRLLVWQADEPAQAKLVQVRLSEGIDAVVNPMTVDGVDAEVTQVSSGVYSLALKPKSLTSRLSVTIPIKIERKDINVSTQRTAFVIVR